MVITRVIARPRSVWPRQSSSLAIFKNWIALSERLRPPRNDGGEQLHIIPIKHIIEIWCWFAFTHWSSPFWL